MITNSLAGFRFMQEVSNVNNVENVTIKNLNIDNNDCTINKSMLINWLISSDEEISVIELGKLIEAKTNGKYSLVKQ